MESDLVAGSMKSTTLVIIAVALLKYVHPPPSRLRMTLTPGLKVARPSVSPRGPGSTRSTVTEAASVVCRFAPVVLGGEINPVGGTKTGSILTASAAGGCGYAPVVLGWEVDLLSGKMGLPWIASQSLVDV